MSSTRSIARRAAALGASVSLVALGVLAASPAQAATCTVTPTTWPDLQSAFASAPATGAVICLGADITAPQSFVPGADRLSQPNGSNVTFDLNAHSLTIAVDPSSGIDAGIAVDAGNTLTIAATGGGAITISGGSYGAAIGASSSSDLGTVIINGGVIDVSTAIDGAGIGGAQFAPATADGSITINGGTITAKTNNCGPGIGAGEYSTIAADITITGGAINAAGTCGSPGIGGSAQNSSVSGNITITGGVITSTATSAAGIGGGFDAAGANITMSGGDLTASTALLPGGSHGAALGSGSAPPSLPVPSPGTLTLIGAGTPTPTSGTAPYASSPMATVLPGPVGITFTQTTQDGTFTQAPSTRIVFTVAVAPRITTTSLPGGTVAAPYAQTVAASGTGPLTFALANGTALPAGLTLDPATGVLSGTPTTAGSFSFQVRATNIMGSDTRAYALEIAAAPAITTASIPGATAGAAYSQTITATGTGPITFGLANGSALPAGLTLDPTSGVISGTPTASGTFTFVVTATNATGTDSRTYTLTVAAAAATPTPSATSAPAARTGSSTLAVTGTNGALAPLLAGGGALLLVVGAGSLIRARGRRQS